MLTKRDLYYLYIFYSNRANVALANYSIKGCVDVSMMNLNWYNYNYLLTRTCIECFKQLK